MLKKCSINDIDLLREISIKTYYQSFVNLNTKENMEAYLKSAFNKEKLYKELMNENSLFFFLYKDSVLSGYLKLNIAPSQTDINDKDSLEIERIYVLKEFQGLDLGNYLIEQSINIAVKKHKKYIWLGVWKKIKMQFAFMKRMTFIKSELIRLSWEMISKSII